MTQQQTLAEIALADIEFIMSECVRLHQVIERIGLKEALKTLSKADLSSLSLPNGGQIFCGAEVMRRIHALAVRALAESDAAGTVEVDRVFRALEHLIPQKLVGQATIGTSEAEELLAAAVNEAKQARCDQTHFIPCRLMRANDPPIFRIGPVTFRAIESFDRDMEAQYAAYVDSADSPQQRELCTKLLGDGQHYYRGFSWVGEVKVANCDPATSEQRAHLAVTAALDILHLLFGAGHTERMRVGGPRMADDRRARFYLDEKGSFHVSCSSSSTSAIGFPDGWAKFFERDDVAFLLRAAGKAIEPLADPSIQRPMGFRFVEAAAWFGEAAREHSDAGRVVKASNALEHLLSTGERQGITKRLSHRAAAVCYDPDREPFDELVREFAAAYRLRCDLVHGSRSPFDPEVGERCWLSMKLTERALLGALALFESHALFDRAITKADLSKGFDRLISVAKHVDAEQRDRSQAPTSECKAENGARPADPPPPA